MDTRGTLRGRAPELAAIQRLLAATAGGQGRGCVVEGPPGIGKSRLLGAATELAARSGIRVLAAAAADDRRTVPFAPFATALREVGGFVADHGDDQLYWAVEKLQRVLERAALDTPLAVVLDDVHWADAGTHLALGCLPQRLSGVPIAWILATRTPVHRPALRAALTQFVRHGGERLTLRGLADDAVAEIVADVVDGDADRALLALARRAGGRPFLLGELLTGLHEEGRLDRRGNRVVLLGEKLPLRFTESMRDRLVRMSEPARRLVRLASVLGEQFSVRHLASALDRRPSQLVETLDEVLDADLLVDTGDQLRFRHDLVRQAVLETLSEHERRTLDAAVATVLLRMGADPAEVAFRIADSARPGDRDAVRHLRSAAHRLAGTDPDTAAALSSRALDLMGDDPGRAELAAVTVTLLHTALRPAQAQALGDREVTGVGGPAEEAALRLSLSQLLALSNGARVRENRRALALAGLAPDLRARHLGWLTYNLASGGWIAEAELVADDALEAARRAGDLEARVMATLGAVVTDTVRGTLGQALQRVHELDRAVAAAGDLPFVWLVDIHHANVLSRLGRSQEALAMLAAGVAHGRRTRNGFLIDSWAQRGSILRFEAGQLSDARMEAESSPTMVAQALAGSNAGAGGLLTTAQVAFHTGDGRRLRHAATAATQLYEHGSPAIRRIAAWILMLAALHRGDAAEAAGRLGDDELPYAAPTLPFDLSYQPTVARVAMAAGEHHLAARALEVAETFAAANPDVPVVVAAAALTRGIVGRSTPDLVDAARALRGTQRPLLFAQASEQAGLALCAADGHDAGIPFLRDALAGYLETEADADARRVSRMLRGFGIRPRSPARRRSRLSPDGLTRSERRVALLVAGGATNSAAAEQLFLSPHTVSAHLRRTFAKLGVNSRVELARLIHESTRETTGSPDE